MLKIVLDNEINKGFHYQGFPLRNFNGTNFYFFVSLEECQYLCEINDYCMFFNYLEDMRGCWLKFGAGKKVSEKNIKEAGYFGHKYSSGTLVL